jgi:ATP-dependent RNA helicase DeaD
MTTFKDLGVLDKILPVLEELGYESPSPIQEKSIPVLLEGKDLLAQAQTGTGKTAAFALPILSKIDLNLKSPQAIVLAPTRELAIQVAESFQHYAKYLPNFHVLPIYGGQDYRPQLSALKRGPHVIVGTPGRVMDHLERGTLKLSTIKIIVLDEADEMLNMGFLEDVKWILKKIDHKHQSALFSATMPDSIRRIADTHLTSPTHIKIQANSATVDSIKQLAMLVSQESKLEALTRFLEVENIGAALIFARTKIATTELAEKLQARGYIAAAINGDMSQTNREKVIRRIKSGSLDIVVATEVAARGLDVERISHVINYDIPLDPESYVHRIGRTGRAGRDGVSLLFVTPRERRMLRDIERAIHAPITFIDPPTVNEIQKKRMDELGNKVRSALQNHNLDVYRNMVDKISHDHEVDPRDVAAAMAFLSDKATPLKEIKKENMGFEDEAPRGRSRQRNRSGGSGRSGGGSGGGAGRSGGSGGGSAPYGGSSRGSAPRAQGAARPSDRGPRKAKGK